MGLDIWDENFLRIGVDVPEEPRSRGVERGVSADIGRRGPRPIHGVSDLEGDLPFYDDDFPGRGRGIGIAKAAISKRRIGPEGHPNRGVVVWARSRPGKPEGTGQPEGQGQGK